MECYLSTKEETIMCTSWMDLSRVMWLKRAGLKRLHIWFHLYNVQGLPWWLSGKESACQRRRLRFDPWVRKIPWRRKCQPTPVSLPGERHGQWSLAGYNPWSYKESDTTEHAHIRIIILLCHTLSFINSENLFLIIGCVIWKYLYITYNISFPHMVLPSSNVVRT